MRPDERDLGYLWRMAREAGDAVALSADLTLEQLQASMRDQRAISHALEQLGEAASRLSAEFRAAHPQVEWRRIVGVRNRLAHDYQATDWEIVWNILRDSVPSLLAFLDAYLPADADGEPT